MRIAAVIIALIVTHVGYFYDGDIRSFWFTGNALVMLLLSTSKAPKIKVLRDIVNGYFIGYFIDMIRLNYLGGHIYHLGELLVILLPILGYLWRNYRDSVSTAIAVSSISLIIKYIAIGAIWLFNKIVG